MPPTTATGRRSSRSSTLLRLAAAGLLAIAVATCSDDHMGGPSRGGAGYFGFRPVTHLSGPPASFGIVIDSVHIRLTRLPSTVVLDTTAFFPADSSNLKLALLVSLAQQTDTLEALIELKAGSIVVFRGTQSVVIVNGPPGSSPLPVVNLAFVGPGDSIAHITVAPKDTAIALGDSVRYSATAVDSSSQPVTQFYVGWKTSDTTLAKMNATGLLRAPNHRGSLKVIGTTPTGIADTTTVFFVPVATALVRISGDSQTGAVGAAPALPLTVQAKALDNLGVAGVPVHFSVISGGGSVTDSLVITDSLGHAATPVTLGTGAGKQLFLARAGALAPDTFTVTAAAGAPSAIAIDGGNAQSDTTSFALPLPLAAKVTDAFGNAVTGAKVAWLKVAGGGSVASDTTVTDTAGVAKVSYTLGGLARTDTVSATLAGTGAKVSFTATAITAAAANIVLANGGGQTDTIGKALPQPFVVFVSDARAHLVAGARVIWTAAHGGGSFAPDTVFTDTTGHAQTTYTVGTLAGTDTLVATAQCACATAKFTVTALAAGPAGLALVSGNAQSDTTGTPLPAPLTVKATDSFGNAVAGAKVIWLRLAGGGTVGTDTATTDAAGLAATAYTLGLTPRVDSIRATLFGTAATVTFTATAVAPAPAAIVIAGGSAQSDTVGKVLALPLAVTVTGAGTKPVAGAKVAFSIKSGTGTFAGPAVDTVTTDTLGHAQVSFTIGNVAGVDSVQAKTVAGGFTVTFAETAIAAAPSAIAIISGNAQSDTVLKAVPLPLIVKVTDAFANPIAGAKVVWSIHAGGGSFAPSDTAVTAVNGQASIAYTLPAAAGLDSLRATIAGTPAFVNFTATGTAGLASGVTIASGSAQSDTVAKALPLPLVVRIADASNNPVAGAKVFWTRVFGSGTVSADSNVTDAAGHAQITFTLGALVGTDSIKAALSGGANVVFIANGTADAPAAVTATGGTGQSGSTGTALPNPLVVKVTDSHGNAVSGVPVVWAVTAGGGSITGVTSVTDATGSASVTQWTLGGLSGSNTVTATVTGAAGSPITFTAVALPLGTTKTWTGSAGTTWATAGSWSPAGIPISTDNVFIPSTAPAPSLAASASVGGLQLETGAHLTLNAGDTLTTLGTVLVPAGATVTGTGAVTLNGTTQQVSGSIANLNVTNAAQLTAATSVTGNVSISGSGSLAINGKSLGVGGAFTLSGSGQLVMTNAADSVDVGGTYTASGAASGADLSAGVLVLRGNFSQQATVASDFAATGTHLTRFAGSATQTLTFANPAAANSHFQNVEFANAAGVTVASDFFATGSATVTAGLVSGTNRMATIVGLTDATSTRWHVDTTAFTATGTVTLPDSMNGTVAVVGAGASLAKAFKLNGDLFLTGTGSLAASGHPLTVTGNVALAGSAHLQMTNAADSVDIGGTFVAAGASSTGDMTAGKLVLRGAFAQVANVANDFAPSGTHQTIFAGTAGQLVSFANPSAANSHFANVTFANPAGITLASDLVVAGNAAVSAGQVVGVGRGATIAGSVVDTKAAWRPDTTIFTGSPVLPDSMFGSVHLQGTDTLAGTFKALGGLTVDGSGVLVLNGHTLLVAGPFTTAGSGRMVMANALDTVDVGGLYTANSTTTSAGDLVKGNLILRGNFTQLATSAANFSASGTHRTVFAGTAPQAVSFADPATGNSHFQDLTVNNGAGVTFGTSVFVNGSVIIDAGNVTGAGRMAFIGTDLVDATNSRWQVDTTTFTGSPALPDSFTGVIHFQGTVTLPKPFKVIGAAFLDGASVFTPAGHPFTVTGALGTNGGRLVMTNASDSVDVGGAYTVNSVAGVGDLTNGKLILRGNFTQVANAANDFAGTLLHQTIFAGSSLQTITFGTPSIANSRFQDLVIDNPAGVSFATAGVVAGSATVLQGSVTAAGHGVIIGKNLSDASNVSWRPDTTTFNGAATALPDSIQSVTHFVGDIVLTKALKIKGAAFVESSGILQPTGHPFTATGAFSTTGNGRLEMTNVADSVDVGGTYTAGSSTTSVGDLTAGVLVLRGNLVQVANSASNFAPSGSHKTRFLGGAAQTLSFGTPSVANSHFQDVEFNNAAGITALTGFFASGTVTSLAGNVTGAGKAATLAGTLIDASSARWQLDTTIFTGTPASLPDSIHGVVHFQSPVTMAKALRIAGALYLDGTNGVLTPNGFPLTVTGALQLAGSGQLRMLSGADSVDVGGMTVATGTSGTGLDTTGVLVMRGGFHQTGGTPTGFAASGSHRTRLVTGSVDSVSFFNPSFTSGSHFSNVEITAGTATIALGSDVEAIGTITKAPGAIPTLHGRGSLLKTNGLDVDGLVLDSLRLIKSGTVQVVRFDSVTFVHADSTFDQFTLIEGGSGTPQTFNHIAFSNPVAFGTGHYLVVADSLGNSQPVTINLNRSTPLYGGSFTQIISGNDGAAVNWSHLAYAPAPTGGESGLVLPTFRVALVGPLGDTLTDVSDTVTSLIWTNPVGGVLSGTTTVPTIGGIATFSNLILTGVGNGYVLQSGANGFDPLFSPTLNIDIQIPPGINAVWRGTVDSLWTKAANWQSGLLPDSASNVFIPVTLHNPYLGTSGFVHLNRLVIAAGAGFKADTFSTVQVDSSLDNSAIVTGGGIIQLARAGTVRGIFNTVAVTGNFSVTPGSTLLANRDLTVSGVGAKLDLNGTNSATNGSLTVTSGGLLVMTHAGDTLSVTGDASFSGGNELGFLTAGRILLQGNLAQYGSSQTGPSPTAFAATAGHVTELLRGSGIQTVHFANPDTTASHFGSLVLSGADSVVFDTLTIALGNVSLTGANVALQSHDTFAVAGNVTTAAGSRLWLTGLGVAGTLNVAGAYHVGTTGFVGAGQAIPALPYDTVRVVGAAALGANATALRFYVGGAYPVAQFDLGGHTLTVNGDFTVDSAGVLVMTSPNDTLAVNGNFSTAGRSTYGTLTNGAIDIGGSFTQADGASLASFAATGAHAVRFLSGQHDWGFANPDTGAAGSHFANLVVLSGGVARDTARARTFVSGNLTLTGGTLVDSMFTSGETGTINYPVIVAGNVDADATSTIGALELDVGGTIIGPSSPAQFSVGTTVFTGTGQTVPVLPYQNVAVSGSAVAGTDLTVPGNLTIEDGAAPGTFDAGGHTVTIVGELFTYDHGALVMTHAADSVDVGSGGSFVGANFGGGSEAGRLTAGTLVIQGNFKQTQRPFALTPTNDSAFFATGSHRTVFTGGRGNNIQYATQATRFNKLDITGTGGANISPVNTVPFVVADTLLIRQGSLFDGGRERVVALGPVVADSQSLLFVDTLEVYSTLSVPVDTNFGADVVRFFGANQAIPSNLSYLNVDILGTAHPTARFEAQDTLNIIGGQFDVNGQLVIADSAFSTASNGTLKMTDPADSVLVFGSVTFAGGSTAGLLTAGVFQTPHFHQMSTNSAESFAASGSHRLDIINNPIGTGEQIDFQTAGGTGGSHAQNMSISGFTAIQLTNDLFVGDTLIYDVSDGFVNSAGAKVTVMGPYVQAAFNSFNVDTLELHDSTAILNPSNSSVWGPGVTIFAGTNQLIRDTISYRNIEITGTAHLGFFASADTVIVNGGTLDLRGSLAASDFSTVNGGVLQMTTGGNNNLFIGGNAVFAGGSTAGKLTAGTITLQSGSFSQGGGAADAFASSGTAVAFTGSDFLQNVAFANPGPSHFANLSSTNGLGLSVHGVVVVNDSLTMSGSVQGDTLIVQGAAGFNNPVAPGAYTVNLQDVEVAQGFTTNDTWAAAVTHFTGPTTLPAVTYNDVVINAPVSAFPNGLSIANLYVAGPGAPLYEGSAPAASLTLSPGTFLSATLLDVQQGSFTTGGGNVDLAGDLQIGFGGTLVMNQAADSIFVGGDAIFQGNSTAGQLTDGTLIVGGSLAQFDDPHAFAPSGNHLTEFVGPNPGVGATHSINFTNPTTSGFANLREDFPDTLVIAGGGQANVAGLLTVTQSVSVPGLVIRGAAAGASMSFGGSDIHSAVFDTVAASFTDAQPMIAFDGVTFNSPTDNFTQFAASGPAGDSITITGPIFTTIGSGTGLYVSATNTSGSGTFTVQALGSNENQLEFLAHVLGDVFSLINWLIPG